MGVVGMEPILGACAQQEASCGCPPIFLHIVKMKIPQQELVVVPVPEHPSAAPTPSEKFHAVECVLCYKM